MARFEHSLAGSSGPVRLNRDENGVAHIHAESRDDALLGLGYCHARDRGLQMLFVRIIGKGQGSRWLQASDTMLSIDRYFRRCDFLADADTEFARLSPQVKPGFHAYAEGINTFFEEKGLPWELRLLGYEKGFTPWTFADSVVTGKVIGYVSLGATQGEMERWIVESIRAGVPTTALEELFPGELAGLDLDLIRRLNLGEPVIPEELWSVTGLPWAMASNSWVVDGSRTASGKPILCNDPHLEINRIPPVWYETALHWPGHYAIGATMPGAPGIVLGRNNRLSWGVTYSYMDCVDSWIEDCRDGCYRRGDGWKPLRARVETIERKGKPAETVTFYETEEHGTISGDPSQEPGLYLATRWSCGTGTAAQAVETLMRMLDATTIDQGQQILSGLNNSAWVFVLADVDGNIGLQMSGPMPLRGEGATGLVPLPGWDLANDWQGFASFEDLPRGLNPPSGFFVAANNDLNPYGKRAPINLKVASYRANRIRELIENHEGKLTIEDMKRFQVDVISTQARAFLEHLRPLLKARLDDPNARVLLDWNLGYEVGSAGAAVFERFYLALFEEVFGKRLGRPALAHLRNQTSLIAEFYNVFDRVLLSEASLWFSGRSRDEVYFAALDHMTAQSNSPIPIAPPASLFVEFHHILFGGKLPRFLAFDRGPFPLAGGRATVSQCQVGIVAGRQIAGCPSIRMIADLSVDEIATSLPGGPSDRRFTPWYANELTSYLQGKYKRLRPS